MAKSTRDNTKPRKRPSEPGQLVGVRLHAPDLPALDNWIQQQPDPKPTRPEAIRVALRDWLTGLGLMKVPNDREDLH